jgi:GNAT superfamily N-acetyltransferase
LTRERSVLLVHPPFICPAATPQLPAMAAASLRAAGASVSVYDGNQEFCLHHLLIPAFLQNCLERVQFNSNDGLYRDLNDSRFAEILGDINDNREQWRGRCAKAGEIPEILRGERFYDPADLVAVRGDLDAILALVSLAYYPLRLHWNGLHHPDVRSWDAAFDFSHDQNKLFKALMESFKRALHGSKSVVFCIKCQDQLLPALTLWSAIKGERPEMEVMFWGPGLNAPNPPMGITWLYGGDPKALCAALDLPDAGSQPPDYHGLDFCLAPELVTDGERQYQLGQEPSLDDLQDDHKKGVAIAAWTVEQGIEPKSLEKALRLSSKAGMWNKVELALGIEEELTDWCAANPNLAHTVSNRRKPNQGFSGPQPEPWPEEPMVGALPPMPGRPFWRWLDQDLYLTLYLRKYGVRKIRTQRVRQGGTVHPLGQQVEYHFVHYPDLKEWHIKNMLKLITFAGKVKPDWLRYNMERSYLIAYALEEGIMVATETLKHPRPEYIQKVRERTGLDFTKYLERGYFVVRPEYRGMGVGDSLVKGCLSRAEGYKTFLTVATENKTAQEMTSRHGTRFLLSYFSKEMGKQIEIWTPGDQEDSSSKSEAK